MSRVILSSSACQNHHRARRISVAVRGGGDTTPHVLRRQTSRGVGAARSRARSCRRLEAARAAYDCCGREAAAALRLAQPATAASRPTAGLARVTREASDRVARIASGGPIAIARERTRDFAGAIRAYNALGARLDALRLRINPPADDAIPPPPRARTCSVHIQFENSPDTREAIDLFDKVFTTTTPAEELTIARAAAKSGVPERAATAYAKALAAGLGDVSDNVGYGSVLFRLRRYADAATQFTKVKTPAKLAAAAQYQRARAQIALGNTEAGRSTLRAITTAYPTDTSAASALLLLADLATDDNRDRRCPSASHAMPAFFRQDATPPTRAFARHDRVHPAVTESCGRRIRLARHTRPEQHRRHGGRLLGGTIVCSARR